MASKDNKALHAMLALVFGLAGTFAGLYLAIDMVGPLVRSLVGIPVGSNEDYITRQALGQALTVQAITITLVFFVEGVALSVVRYPAMYVWTLVAANPFCVGYAYYLYQKQRSGMGPAEYFGYFGLTMLAITAPMLFGPSMLLGLRLGSRLRRSKSRSTSS